MTSFVLFVLPQNLYMNAYFWEKLQKENELIAKSDHKNLRFSPCLGNL